MGDIEVKAKKGDNETAVSYNFGKNLADAVAKFTEDVVFTNFRQAAKITLQAGLRRCLEAGKDPVEFAGKFKPGVQTATGAVDPVVAMKAKFAGMSNEERAEFLNDLKNV